MSTGSGYLHREAFGALHRLVTWAEDEEPDSPVSPRGVRSSWSTWPAITNRASNSFMGVGPSDSRSGGAWRAGHMDGAHALLPAEIFASSVQWGARGEIVESLPRLHDRSTASPLPQVWWLAARGPARPTPIKPRLARVRRGSRRGTGLASCCSTAGRLSQHAGWTCIPLAWSKGARFTCERRGRPLDARALRRSVEVGSVGLLRPRVVPSSG